MSDSSANLRCMYVVGRLNDEASGVTRILCDLANTVGQQGSPVSVYAADCPGMPSSPNLLQPPSRYLSAPGAWVGGLCPSRPLREKISDEIANFDIVHHHSLWMLPNHYAAESAVSHKIPSIWTAHGALEPWALNRSGWKKKLVGWLWQWRDLRNAVCIHVNSVAEQQAVQSLKLGVPTAVLPNGIDLLPFTNLPPRRALHDRFPELTGKKVLLFLSRLHAKKGLAPLIDAWKNVSRDFSEWHLLIAGPDDGAEAETRQRVISGELSQRVTFAGPLRGGAKLAAFAAADLFVLPSFSEGFSMSILEAMGACLPVLLTPGCHFPEAVAIGAAIEMTPDTKDIERALRDLCGLADPQRIEMGQRGRKLVETSYTWPEVASKMLQLYRWLCEREPKPEFAE